MRMKSAVEMLGTLIYGHPLAIPQHDESVPGLRFWRQGLWARLRCWRQGFCIFLIRGAHRDVHRSHDDQDDDDGSNNLALRGAAGGVSETRPKPAVVAVQRSFR